MKKSLATITPQNVIEIISWMAKNSKPEYEAIE